MILKSGVKIVGGVVIGIATGGTGLAAMATAAGAQTALSFTVDAADLATSERGGTAEQYLTIARQSAIDGLSQVASGGASLAIKGTALPHKAQQKTAVIQTIPGRVKKSCFFIRKRK